jgi:hypothetical protein
MIITDPALAAIEASLSSLGGSIARRSRFRFWSRRTAGPTFGTEAYYAGQLGTFADGDLTARSTTVTEPGGVRVHASTRHPTHAR